MKRNNSISLHPMEAISLPNLTSNDYEFAREYVNKFREEFIAQKATDIDMDDIFCAILNGINYGRPF